ncbi:MAG: MotA/TolQ/ExbB proton channel family protein [Campylobacterales bacterium]|nr:MotA/TolQ/ExbB proton channel family protein [Campylobacterales bacterium]
MFIALVRGGILLIHSSKISAQLKAIDVPKADNPLGRLLSVYQSNAAEAVEIVESRLDEAILKELPSITRGEALIKLLAAVAPLLGLLGTVVGMIETFQAITLFGTGDPKLMAGGISQALVTTMQGLIVAVPLLFAHALVRSRSRAIIEILSQQSAGLIARRMERR